MITFKLYEFSNITYKMDSQTVENRDPKLILKKILQDISFCCVCFVDTKDLYDIEKCLIIMDMREKGFISMKDIIQGIFGELTGSLLFSNHICKSCKESAVLSYIFITNVKRNAELYNEYLTQLAIKTEHVHNYMNKYGELSNTLIILEDPNESHEHNADTHKKHERKLNNNNFKLNDNLTCECCNKVFTSKAGMASHLSSKNKLPHKHKKAIFRTPKQKQIRRCEHCDYTTRFAVCLEAHVNRFHLKISPYECKLCHKRFTEKYKLSAHYLVHKKVKRHVCERCGRLFGGASGLKKHIRLHTGERPYPCHSCEQSFKCASDRGLHIQKKHMDKSIICPLCSEMFATRSCLRKHVAMMHWKREGKFDYTKLEGLTEKDYDLFRDHRMIML